MAYQRFIRFSTSGTVAFAIDLGLLILLTEFFNVWYLASAGISFIVATTVHYIASRHFAFYKTRRDFKYGYVLFVLFAAIMLALNLGSLALLVEYAGIEYYRARLATGIILGLISYAVNAKLTFKMRIFK